MDTQVSGGTQAPSAPLSQTGSSQAPTQVENVQYNVRVGRFSSRVSLAYALANTSLFVLVLVLAWALYAIAGKVFQFGDNKIGERIIAFVAVALPLLPLFLFSQKRLRKFMEDPASREDIIFKKNVRRSLWLEIILGVLNIVFGIYEGLSVLFLGTEGNALQHFSSVVFFGGGFAFLAWWSYSYQKLTHR